jgi:hypothetical protein
MAEAVRDMVEQKISSLVVVKNSAPIGMITITDVLESVLERQKSKANKVMMSGFDSKTYQYEEEAKAELMSFVAQIERLSGIDVDYLTFKVKRSKEKYYEMHARLSLGKHGIMSISTNKYLFEDALRDLITKLKHKVIKEKESIITHKRELKQDTIE